jgi:hypothetical protein
MSTEPWQAFYDKPTFLPPGELLRWQREEAAMRAEEQRLEAERAERAELREELALWEARQYSAARGLPWDPSKPYANLPTIYQRADAAFALQDREQRDADRRALRDANLDHLVGDLPRPGLGASGVVSPPPEPSSAGSASGAASRSRVPAHRYGLPRGPGEPSYVRLRLRRFLDRAGRTDR